MARPIHCCKGEPSGYEDEDGIEQMECDEWCDCPSCMSRYSETTRI